MLMKENLNNYNLLQILVIFIFQLDPKSSRKNEAENAVFC